MAQRLEIDIQTGERTARSHASPSLLILYLFALSRNCNNSRSKLPSMLRDDISWYFFKVTMRAAIEFLCAILFTLLYAALCLHFTLSYLLVSQFYTTRARREFKCALLRTLRRRIPAPFECLEEAHCRSLRYVACSECRPTIRPWLQSPAVSTMAVLAISLRKEIISFLRLVFGFCSYNG